MTPHDGTGDHGRTSTQKSSGWRSLRGLGYYPLAVVVLVIAWHITDFVRMGTAGLLPVTFEADDDPTVRVDLSGIANHQLNGIFTVDVPLENLTGTAVGFQVSAAVLFVTGLAVCGWFGTRLLKQILDERAFTASALRSVGGLEWAVLATGLLPGFVQMLADNLVVRDLGLAEAGVSTDITARWLGMTSQSFFLFLSIFGAIELLHRILERGKQAQDDLAGLI